MVLDWDSQFLTRWVPGLTTTIFNWSSSHHLSSLSSSSPSSLLSSQSVINIVNHHHTIYLSSMMTSSKNLHHHHHKSSHSSHHHHKWSLPFSCITIIINTTAIKMWINIIKTKLNSSKLASGLLPLQYVTYRAALRELQGSLCAFLLVLCGIVALLADLQDQFLPSCKSLQILAPSPPCLLYGFIRLYFLR